MNAANAIQSFETFLLTHKYEKTPGHSYTHTRMPSKELQIFGGSYYIPDEDLDEFYKLYTEKMKTGRHEHLTEKQRDDKRVICIDLDFKYEATVDTRQHSTADILNIVCCYAAALAEVTIIPADMQIPIYVMEKPDVNTNDEKYTKDGIHILFGAASHFAVSKLIHDIVLENLPPKMTHLPIKNSWDDVMDENVTRLQNPVGWTLYGSRKPANDRYELTHVYHLKDHLVEEQDIVTFEPFKNIELLSVRNRNIPVLEVADKEALEKKTRSQASTRTNSPSSASACVLVDDEDDYKAFVDLNCPPITADKQNTWFWNAVSLMRHFEGETAIQAVHYYSSTAPNYDYENNKDKVDAWLNEYNDDKFAKTIRFKKPMPERGICHIVLKEQEEEDDKEIIAMSEEEVAQKAYEKLKTTFMSINKQLYGKWGNIWCCSDAAQWDALLCNAIVALKIKKRVIKEHKFGQQVVDIVWCDTMSHLTAIHKRVKQMVVANPRDDMYDLFHSSTLGKMCFEDGVYNFTTKKFHKWESQELKENPVYSCVKISRKFPSSVEKWTEDCEDYKKAYSVFHEAMGKEQAEKFLAYLARVTAGKIEDKVFSFCMFNRDCSKGVINDWFIAAFGNYIGQADGNALVLKDSFGDSEKENGWLIPLQYCRHVFISELEVDPKNPRRKINSKLVKSMCSGGDPMKARLMRENGVTFRLQCGVNIMANDLMPFSSPDVLEKCLMLKSVIQFKTQEYINAELERCKDSPMLHASLKRLKVADQTIRTKVKTNEWADALVRIMIHYYSDNPVVVNSKEEKGEDDESEALDVKVVARFNFTGLDTDKVTNEKLRAFATLNNTSLLKLKATIMGIDERVKDYKSGSVKGVKGILEILPSAVEEE
jgi:hypothetical protein